MAADNDTIPSNLPGSITVFRIAYLKAIVAIWQAAKDNILAWDTLAKELKQKTPPDQIRKILLQVDRVKPDSPLLLLISDNILDEKAFIQFIPGQQKITWKSKVQTVLNPNHEYSDDGYGPIYDPDFGWLGSQDDHFVIDIPVTPPVEKKAAAITQYYEVFTTILGGFKHTDVAGTGINEADMEIGGSNNFLVFGRLIMKVLAYCWENPGFLKEITKPEVHDATPIINGYFKYLVPWNFKITFTKNENIDYNQPEDHWFSDVSNIVRLNFPHPPTNASIWSVAVTRYNDTGPAYPFTCI